MAAPTRETLSQETARVFCEALDQRPCFHTLSLIASVSAIPLLNRIGLDGSWIAAAGQGLLSNAQNRKCLVGIPTSLAAGYMVLGALKIWAKTQGAPVADSAKHKANVTLIEQLTNAMSMCDRHAGDFSKQPLLTRFHQIMRAFDTALNPDSDETPVVDNPSASFSAPFKTTADSANPGAGLAQRYVRAFSNLSQNSVWLHALGLSCSAISYKIIPMLKLDGTWTNALLEKIHKVPGFKTFTGETLINPLKKTATEWHVAERVGKIAAGYLAVMAVKGLLSWMKAPNADKAAKAKAVKTLAQLSYAMHVVETRAKRNELAGQFNGETLTTKILALPCSKAPLLDRFNNITKSYSRAMTQLKLASKKQTEPAPETTPEAPANDGLFSQQELEDSIKKWISAPTEAAKNAFLDSLSAQKQNQVIRCILRLQAAAAAAHPAGPPATGTGGTPAAT